MSDEKFPIGLSWGDKGRVVFDRLNPDGGVDSYEAKPTKGGKLHKSDTYRPAVEKFKIPAWAYNSALLSLFLVSCIPAEANGDRVVNGTFGAATLENTNDPVLRDFMQKVINTSHFPDNCDPLLVVSDVKDQGQTIRLIDGFCRVDDLGTHLVIRDVDGESKTVNEEFLGVATKDSNGKVVEIIIGTKGEDGIFYYDPATGSSEWRYANGMKIVFDKGQNPFSALVQKVIDADAKPVEAGEVTKTPIPTATLRPTETPSKTPTETKTDTPVPPTKEPTLEPWKAEMERKLQGVFGSEWMGDGKGLNQNGINKYGEFNLQFVFGNKSSIVKDYPITLGGVQGVRVRVGAEAFYLYKGKLSSVKVATVLEFTREDGSKYLCELLEVKPITESTIRERANGTPENPYNPGLGGYYGNPTLGYRAGVSVELDSNQYDGKSLTCGPQVQELLATITNTTEYKDFIASGKPSEDLVLVPTGFGFGTGGVIDIKGEDVDLEN